MRIKFVAAALFGLVLSACGGGGGGGTSVSVEPKSLSFTVGQGDPVPAGKDVTVRFSGDGMIAGYEEGDVPAGWLDAYQTGPDASPTSMRFEINTTNLSPDTYRASLSFFTGKVTDDGDVTDISSVRLPVTYTVLAPFRLSPANWEQAVVQGSGPVSAEFEVLKQDDRWSATSDASWLTLTPRRGPGGGTLQVTASTSGMAPATYTATITLRDDTGQRSARTATFRLVVRAPELIVSGDVQIFTALSGQAALPPARPIPVQSEADAAVAYSVRILYDGAGNWLSLPPGGTAPSTLSLSPSTTALAPGDYNATVELTPANGTAVRIFPVRYVLAAASLGIASAAVDIDSTTVPSDLSGLGLGLTDSGAVLNWRIGKPDAEWLTVLDPSGDTASSAGPRLKINTDRLSGLANGSYVASVPIFYGNAVTPERQGTATVSLDLSLGRVEHVMPSYADTQQARPLQHIIRGKGFSRLGEQPLLFGAVTVRDFTVVSDTEIHLLTPGLDAGHHDLMASNALGLDTSSAAFAMVSTPSMPAYMAARDGNSVYRLIYDPRRQSLYAREWRSLTRMRFIDGRWVEDRLFEHEDLFDLVQSLDGRWLYFLVDNTLMRLDLDNPSATPAMVTGIDSWNRFYYLDKLDVQNDGRFIMSKGLRGSGYIDIFGFNPVVDVAPVQIGLSGCAFLATALDGRRTVVGSGCASWRDRLQVVDAGGIPVQTTIPDGVSWRSFATDRSGRLILADSQLYDTQWRKLGSLPVHSFGAFTQDGRRLLALEADGSGYQVRVYDTSQPASRSFPLLGTLGLVDIDGPITTSPDGRTAFLMDARRFMVIPIPEALR